MALRYSREMHWDDLEAFIRQQEGKAERERKSPDEGQSWRITPEDFGRTSEKRLALLRSIKQRWPHVSNSVFPKVLPVYWGLLSVAPIERLGKMLDCLECPELEGRQETLNDVILMWTQNPTAWTHQHSFTETDLNSSIQQGSDGASGEDPTAWTQQHSFTKTERSSSIQQDSYEASGDDPTHRQRREKRNRGASSSTQGFSFDSGTIKRRCTRQLSASRTNSETGIGSDRCIVCISGIADRPTYIVPAPLRKHDKETDRRCSQLQQWIGLYFGREQMAAFGEFLADARRTERHQSRHSKSGTERETCTEAEVAETVRLCEECYTKWTAGAFVLKPLWLSNDGTEMQFMFIWQQREFRKASEPIDLAAPRCAAEVTESTEDISVQVGRSWNHEAINVVNDEREFTVRETGDIITLRTPNPKDLPLPDLIGLKVACWLGEIIRMRGQDEYDEHSDADEADCLTARTLSMIRDEEYFKALGGGAFNAHGVAKETKEWVAKGSYPRLAERYEDNCTSETTSS